MDDESFEARYQRYQDAVDREEAAQMAVIEARVQRARRQAWEQSAIGRLVRWVRGWWLKLEVYVDHWRRS